MSRHMVVDGYNVLHQWVQVAPLMSGGDLHSAREALIAAMAEYQSQTGIRVSIVFDSRTAARPEIERQGMVEIIFAHAAQSADHTIERLVFLHARREDVTVVTSDGLQREVVSGQGAQVMHAAELLKELTRTSAEVSRAAERTRSQPAGKRLDGRIGAGARTRLEEIRLGPDWARRRRESAERLLREHRVVAVIRTDSQEAAIEAGRAAHRAGLRCIEITTSVPAFDEVLRTLADVLPHDCILGAGTLIDPGQAARAHEAGARFAVSPVGLPEIAAFSAQRGMLPIPGAFSPTEVWRAHRWGSPLVKLFPLGASDGPRHVRAIALAFPDVALLASGGATPENVHAYFAAGAVAVSAGTAIFEPVAIAQGDWERVQARCAQLRSAVRAS